MSAFRRLLLGAFALAPALVAAQASRLSVPYTLDTLPNSLTLIVHEDHSVPIATTNVWFHVGSGDEKPGRTGFAHLFEHLMFMGSQHAEYPQFDRLSPDYAAITVMNAILGGSFSSRLMTNLREIKGYTYGITSGFRWQPLPGPFLVLSSLRTNVTDSSLVEILRELHAMCDAEVDAKELERAKAYVALAVAAQLETNGQIASQLLNLGSFGLPLSSVSDFVAKVNAVTTTDVRRVARQYVPVDKATLVVVGDLAKVRTSIDALKLGTISVLDVSSIAK